MVVEGLTLDRDCLDRAGRGCLTAGGRALSALRHAKGEDFLGDMDR